MATSVSRNITSQLMRQPWIIWDRHKRMFKTDQTVARVTNENFEPQKFENGGFKLWKHIKCFLPHHAEGINNATFTAHFVMGFEENSDRDITWFSWCHRFEKLLFSWKAPFSWRIRVDGTPIEIKLRFQISRTLPLSKQTFRWWAVVYTFPHPSWSHL